MSAAEGIVVATVLEIVPDLPAELNTQVRRDSHVTPIEQDMQIRSQQKPVAGSVWAAVGIPPNVGRFQYRQSSFSGDCTTATVGISDQCPE